MKPGKGTFIDPGQGQPYTMDYIQYLAQIFFESLTPAFPGSPG